MQAAKAAKALRDVDLINISAQRTAPEASIEAHEAWMANRYKYVKDSNYAKRGLTTSSNNKVTEETDNDRSVGYPTGSGGDSDGEGLDAAEGLLAAMEDAKRKDKANATRAEISEANAELAASVEDKEELLLETTELQIENARSQARSLQERNDLSRNLIYRYNCGYRCPDSSNFNDDRLAEQLQLILYPNDVRGYTNPILRKAAKAVMDPKNNVEAATAIDEDHTLRTAKELQRLCEAIVTGNMVAPVADSISRKGGGKKRHSMSVNAADDAEEEEDEEEEDEDGDNDIANDGDVSDGADDSLSSSKRRRSSMGTAAAKAERELAAFLDHSSLENGGGMMIKGMQMKTSLPRDFHSGLRSILELLCELVLIKNARVIALKEENAAIAKEKVAEQQILKGLIQRTREEAVKEKERQRKMEEMGTAEMVEVKTVAADGTVTITKRTAPISDSPTTTEIRRIRAERKEKDKALSAKRQADQKTDEAKILAVKEKLMPLMSSFFPAITHVKQTAEDIAAAIRAEIEAKEKAASRPPRPGSATLNSSFKQKEQQLNASTTAGAAGVGVGEDNSSPLHRARSTGTMSVISGASTTAAAAARGAVGLLVSMSLASLTQLAVKMSGALNMSNLILAQVALTDEMFERGLFLADGAREDLETEMAENRGPNAFLSPDRCAAIDSKAAEDRIIQSILKGSAPQQVTAGGGVTSPEAPSSAQNTARPSKVADPSGLVDDSPSATAAADGESTAPSADTVGSAAADGVASSKGAEGGEEKKNTQQKHRLMNADVDPSALPTDVADPDWYEKARVEYLKRLDVAMLVTKDRLVQMMMLKEDPTDNVAALHRQQDEDFLMASIQKSEQQRAIRKLNAASAGGATLGANPNAAAGAPPSHTFAESHSVNTSVANTYLQTPTTFSAAANVQPIVGAGRGGAKRVSVQFSEAPAGADAAGDSSPIATGIAVTVNGLTTGGPSAKRVPTAASALRWRLEEQKRQAARDHADATSSIRGVFEKHHKYCYDTLNAEFERKNKVLSQITEHDLPLLEDAWKFQKRTHEEAMAEYAHEQVESFGQMKVLEGEQQRIWVEVEEILERSKPLQEERHRLVEEHLIRSDLEWERRRHYDEWCASHDKHKKNLVALKELLEESNVILQGCRDVHNGMARCVIEAVTFQNVQSRRQSRKASSFAAAAYRRASVAAAAAGQPPPPPPESQAQEVSRRLSRILGEDVLANSANTAVGGRPPSGGAFSSSSSARYGVTFAANGTPIRPMRVPTVPPLEQMDVDSIFDFVKLMEKENTEAEAAEDEAEAALQMEEDLFSSDEDDGENELEALLKEAAEGDNTRSDALALKALRLDHTHTFVSRLYAPFVHVTQELIIRKNARLLIAKKALRLYDDLLGIGNSAGANSRANTASNSHNTSYVGGGTGGGAADAGDYAAAAMNTSIALSHASTAIGADSVVTGEDRDKVRGMRREVLATIAALERDVLLLARRVEFYQPMHEALVVDLAKRDRKTALMAERKAAARRAAALTNGGDGDGGEGAEATAAVTPPPAPTRFTPTLGPHNTSSATSSTGAAAADYTHQYNPLLSAQMERLHTEITQAAVTNLHAWDTAEDEQLEMQMATVVANYAIYEAEETSRVAQREQSPVRPRAVPRKATVGGGGTRPSSSTSAMIAAGTYHSPSRLGMSGNSYFAPKHQTTSSPSSTPQRIPSAIRATDGDLFRSRRNSAQANSLGGGGGVGAAGMDDEGVVGAPVDDRRAQSAMEL